MNRRGAVSVIRLLNTLKNGGGTSTAAATPLWFIAHLCLEEGHCLGESLELRVPPAERCHFVRQGVSRCLHRFQSVPRTPGPAATTTSRDKIQESVSD